MSKKTRRQFSEEFKQDTIALIERENYSLKDASERLGIHESVLGKWKRGIKQKGMESSSLTTENNSIIIENQKLKEENRRLKMERDILKKAAAFFAKESL